MRSGSASIVSGVKQTSQFPEGTILFKELQFTLPAQNPDSLRSEPSRRPFNGADVTVKDTKRYTAINEWGYYNFNHHEPKGAASKVSSREE